jgi:phage terminase Nu1 subunit (DNA packaging protein)
MMTEREREGDELLTEQELADLLKVSVRTVRRWRAEGTGPPVVWAGSHRPRYWRSQVIRWLERGGRETRPS